MSNSEISEPKPITVIAAVEVGIPNKDRAVFMTIGLPKEENK